MERALIVEADEKGAAKHKSGRDRNVLLRCDETPVSSRTLRLEVQRVFDWIHLYGMPTARPLIADTNREGYSGRALASPALHTQLWTRPFLR